MRVFVTGGTGLVGKPLVEALLRRGDDVVLLTRDAAKARPKFEKSELGPAAGKLSFVEGDPSKPEGWQASVDGCDGVLNLAGEPVMGRWTDAKKRAIRDSRVDATRGVVQAIRRAAAPPKVLVSTSAVGYYGNTWDQTITEESPAGNDFLARVCRDWEAAAAGVDPEKTRLVVVRVGVVLAPDGGAVQQMVRPFYFGLGAILGNGYQYISWVHRNDLVRMYLHALDDPKANGTWNGTAPNPATNVEFSHALAKAVWRPCLFFVPSALIKLALGEAAGVLLTGQRAVPGFTGVMGFRHDFELLAEALQDVFSRTPKK